MAKDTEITFEKALGQLEKIVEDLEGGDLSLEVSLKKYEEGVKLARTCQQKLDKAKEKVELLRKKETGLFDREPFEGTEEEE